MGSLQQCFSHFMGEISFRGDHVTISFINESRMVWTVRGDAINGNAETTDRMVTLSSRVETWRF